MLRFATNKQYFLHQQTVLQKVNLKHAQVKFWLCEVHVETFMVSVFWPLTEDAFCVANNRSRDEVLVMVSWILTKKKQKHKHNEQKGQKKKGFLCDSSLLLSARNSSWSGFYFFAKRSQRVCCFLSKTNQQSFHFMSCSLLFCCFVTIQHP